MDFQILEAIRLCNISLNSTTIEWAMNIELCDSLSANPPIAAHLTEHIADAMRGTSVRRASLSLSLVEMLIKNLGISFIRFIDDNLCDAWGSLCQRKSSWLYSITRNMYKVTQQVGTSDDDSTRWQEVMMRALGLLQEASDSLLLYEAEAPIFFRFYKNLRRKHVNFPPKVEAQSALIRGGIDEEELPMSGSQDLPTPSSPSRAAPRRMPDSTPLTAEEVDELRMAVEGLDENPTAESAEVCRRLRPRLVTLIQGHAFSADSELDSLMLEAMMALLSRLDSATEPFAPPPPPEPAPPTQNADFLFALTLQQQELDAMGAGALRNILYPQFDYRAPNPPRAPPARSMNNSDGYLISSTPQARGPAQAIRGPTVHSTEPSQSSVSWTNTQPVENSLETSLLGDGTVKKTHIWGQLRQLALSATARNHTLGEASSASYQSMEEEGVGLIRKRRADPVEQGLLDDDKEEDWDLVRTEKQTYWYNKRTLCSQWTAPQWAQRKAKQFKDL